MIGPEFASAMLKISRAEEHFDNFKREFVEWRDCDPSPYAISRKCNADGSRHALVIDIDKPPPVDRWSLIAGDCVHNLRSALDHMIYAVAVQESGLLVPPNAGILKFPITNTSERFEKHRNRTLSALSAKTQDWVKGLQPNNRPHHKLPPLLTLLNGFDNSDKHRLLHVALQHVAGGKFSFQRSPLLSGLPATPPAIHFLRTAIKSGAEFAFFFMDPPKRDVDYKYEGSIAITVSHTQGPSGEHVSTLHEILKVLIAEVKSIFDGAISL